MALKNALCGRQKSKGLLPALAQAFFQPGQPLPHVQVQLPPRIPLVLVIWQHQGIWSGTVHRSQLLRTYGPSELAHSSSGDSSTTHDAAGPSAGGGSDTIFNPPSPRSARGKGAAFVNRSLRQVFDSRPYPVVRHLASQFLRPQISTIG